MKCRKDRCEYHDTGMTDNCAKGDPPNVEGCNEKSGIFPCPWCGVVPTPVKEFGVFRISCDTKGFCPVQPRLAGTWVDVDKAIEAWNKRPR